jgi:hypothetical protein
VRDGENGFLAADQREWERKLGTLIENPDLCLKMAARPGRHSPKLADTESRAGMAAGL